MHIATISISNGVILDVILVSTALYGSEAWVLENKVKNRSSGCGTDVMLEEYVWSNQKR